jgi:hypothetical protein
MRTHRKKRGKEQMAENPAGQAVVESKTAVHIFVNRRKVELPSTHVTGEQILLAAGFQGREWDLFLLHGESDPTGGTLIQFNQTLTVKNGEQFRVIPGNRTFGS